MAQFPFFTPLASSPFQSLLLTWKPSFSVMRYRPPWSQVARKLTSPSSFPPHSLPIPNSRPPGFPQTNCAPLLRRHRDPGFHGPEHLPTIGFYRTLVYPMRI
jgi:hypothetical protein